MSVWASESFVAERRSDVEGRESPVAPPRCFESTYETTTKTKIEHQAWPLKPNRQSCGSSIISGATGFLVGTRDGRRRVTSGSGREPQRQIRAGVQTSIGKSFLRSHGPA